MPRRALSREQFRQVEDNIIRMAPAGLSPEQLDARIEDGLRNAEGSDWSESWTGGAAKSLADTGVRTLKGVVREATFPVRHPIETLKSPYTLAKDLASGGEGTLATLDAIAQGDPDVGGEAIGGLLLGKFAPKMVPRAIRRIPKALETTGRVVEQAGRSTRRASHYGLPYAMVSGNPAAIAATVAPYAVEGIGKAIGKTGKVLSARQRLSLSDAMREADAMRVITRNPLSGRMRRTYAEGR